MMLPGKTLLLAFCFFLAAGSLRAQDSTLTEAPQGLVFSFRRQNNFTYETRFDLNLNHSAKRYRSELIFHHDHLLNTALGQSPFVQLYVHAQWWQYFRLKKSWEVASWIETDQFWNTGNQRHSLYAGVQYQPRQGLSVTPMIGYSWDYRARNLDQGISPALRLRITQRLAGEVDMQTELFVREKYIQPRRQRNLAFSSLWSKSFSEVASVALEVRGGSNQMDDYKSESVEQIKSDTASVRLSLGYRLGKRFYWESDNQGSFTRRRFDYALVSGSLAEFNNLRFLQTQLITRQKLSYSGRKLSGFFTYEYQYLGRGYELENSLELPEREYTRLQGREQLKDYYRRQITMDLNLSYRPGQRHTLILSGNNRYLQYDTPAEDNFDDHDELNYNLNAEWRAAWSPRFSTRYRMIGGVRRYAFLFGERSQDNYTQRNLRLEFDYRWALLPNLSLRGEQWIYVVYNVKDFTDRNLTDRSNRAIESRIVADWRIGPRWDSDWSVYRKEMQLSYLNWQAFSETSLDTATTWIAEQTNHLDLLPRSRKNHLILDIGYKHLSQLRYLNTSMISLQFILTPINLHIRTHQSGPVTGIQMRTGKNSSLNASVWWQLQYTDYRYRQVESFTSLSASYKEELLQQKEVFFRPFVKLEARIAL